MKTTVISISVLGLTGLLGTVLSAVMCTTSTTVLTATATETTTKITVPQLLTTVVSSTRPSLNTDIIDMAGLNRRTADLNPVPPLGGAKELINNVTYAMGERIGSLQPLDEHGAPTKLIDMCHFLKRGYYEKWLDAFPLMNFRALANGMCWNGTRQEPSPSAAVTESRSNVAYTFAIQFQAAAGDWKNQDLNGEFVKINSELCLNVVPDVLDQMGMNSSIAMDAFCSSGAAARVGNTHGNLPEDVRQAVVHTTTILLGYEYQLLGNDLDDTIYPLHCNGTVNDAIIEEGLDLGDFHAYYCEPIWVHPRLSAVNGRTQITRYMTDLFITQSINSLYEKTCASTLKYLCENACERTMNTVYLDGPRVKQAWCDVAAQCQL